MDKSIMYYIDVYKRQKYNILPPDIISDMDDQKILLCIGLYNTVKFLAEHI